MQNEPNFPDDQMNVNKVLTKDYENETLSGCGKNKPNSNPIKANFQKPKTNVNKVLTKDYEKISNWAICENKPNFNPKQSRTNPIKANFKLSALSQLTFTLLPCPAGSAVPLAICAVPKDGLHTLLLLFGLLWFFSPFSLKPQFLTFFFWILPFFVVSSLTKFTLAFKLHTFRICFCPIIDTITKDRK